MIDRDEIESMRATIKHLERENRAMRVTLRDDFAKAALIGILASDVGQNIHQNEAAECAYAHADAMMEARK